eukprot:Filipodium_phascolosomae@DN7170_c0_g1_i1.p1
MKSRLTGVSFQTFGRLTRLYGGDVKEALRSCSCARQLIALPTPKRLQIQHGESVSSVLKHFAAAGVGGGAATVSGGAVVGAARSLTLPESLLLIEMYTAQGGGCLTLFTSMITVKWTQTANRRHKPLND